MGHDPCHLTASTALICGQFDMTRHCFAHRLIAHVHGLSLASKQISHCTVYCWNKPFICKTRKLPKRYRVHSGVVLRHLRFLGRGVLKDSSSPKLKMFKWWLGGGVGRFTYLVQRSHCDAGRGGAEGREIDVPGIALPSWRWSGGGDEGQGDSRTWYSAPIVALVGGITLLTKKKSASSGRRWIRFRMRKQNCPTVRSDGTRYFFLSRSPTRAFGAFSTITYRTQKRTDYHRV